MALSVMLVLQTAQTIATSPIPYKKIKNLRDSGTMLNGKLKLTGLFRYKAS
jgi:hypothetical protein